MIVRRVALLFLSLALSTLWLAPVYGSVPTELNLWLTPETGNPEWVLAGVEAWKQANPQYKDIKINYGTGWLDKLRPQLAGGHVYDMIMYSSSDVPGMVYNNEIMDLTPYLKSDPTVNSLLRTLVPATVEAQRYKGGIYGLPRFWSAVAVIYNRDFFENRGVPIPGAEWTQDDLINLGKKLSYDSNGDGFTDHFAWGHQLNHHHRWPYWVWSNGGEFYNADLTVSQLNTPAAISGIEKMVSLMTEHGIFPKQIAYRIAEPGISSDQLSNNAYIDLFRRGNLAMFVNSRLNLPAMDFQFGVTVLPKGSVSRTSVMVTAFLAISPQSKYPDVVWSLIKFLASEEGLRAGYNEAVRFNTPANLKMAQQELMRNPPELNPMNWIKAAEDARRADIMHPIGQIGINWDSIVKMEVPVRDAIESAVKAHNARLQEAYAKRPW